MKTTKKRLDHARVFRRANRAVKLTVRFCAGHTYAVVSIRGTEITTRGVNVADAVRNAIAWRKSPRRKAWLEGRA